MSLIAWNRPPPPSSTSSQSVLDLARSQLQQMPKMSQPRKNDDDDLGEQKNMLLFLPSPSFDTNRTTTNKMEGTSSRKKDEGETTDLQQHLTIPVSSQQLQHLAVPPTTRSITTATSNLQNDGVTNGVGSAAIATGTGTNTSTLFISSTNTNDRESSVSALEGKATTTNNPDAAMEPLVLHQQQQGEQQLHQQMQKQMQMQIPADDGTIRVPSGSGYRIMKPFPWRLHEILEEVQLKGLDWVVSWRPDGRSFQVHCQKSFTDIIIPMFFRHSRYKSFQRQLYLYGFRTLETSTLERGAYFHPHFHRENRSLCRHIIRIKAESTTDKKKTKNTTAKKRPASETSSSTSSASKKRRKSTADETKEGRTKTNSSSQLKHIDIEGLKGSISNGAVLSSLPATTVNSSGAWLSGNTPMMKNSHPSNVYKHGNLHGNGTLNQSLAMPTTYIHLNQLPMNANSSTETSQKINFDELRRTEQHRKDGHGSFSTGLLGFSDEIISLFGLTDYGNNKDATGGGTL